MGYDRKYGKVTTEYGDIPEDEPVIVFRARDVTLPKLLALYHTVCLEKGSPQRHLDIIANSGRLVEQWQQAHPNRVRVPDSERSRQWKGEDWT